MSSQHFNFTEDISQVPDASDMRIGFIVSEWNNNITNKLLSSAIETLKEHGMKENNITVRYVPGSFELVYGSALLAQSLNHLSPPLPSSAVVSASQPLKRLSPPLPSRAVVSASQPLNHLSTPLPPSAVVSASQPLKRLSPPLPPSASGFGITASEAPQPPLAILGSGFGVTASMTLQHCLFTSHLVNNFILNYSCLAAGTVFAS